MVPFPRLSFARPPFLFYYRRRREIRQAPDSSWVLGGEKIEHTRHDHGAAEARIFSSTNAGGVPFFTRWLKKKPKSIEPRLCCSKFQTYETKSKFVSSLGMLDNDFNAAFLIRELWALTNSIHRYWTCPFFVNLVMIINLASVFKRSVSKIEQWYLRTPKEGRKENRFLA